MDLPDFTIRGYDGPINDAYEQEISNRAHAREFARRMHLVPHQRILEPDTELESQLLGRGKVLDKDMSKNVDLLRDVRQLDAHRQWMEDIRESMKPHETRYPEDEYSNRLTSDLARQFAPIEQAEPVHGFFYLPGINQDPLVYKMIEPTPSTSRQSYGSYEPDVDWRPYT